MSLERLSVLSKRGKALRRPAEIYSSMSLSVGMRMMREQVASILAVEAFD